MKADTLEEKLQYPHKQLFGKKNKIVNFEPHFFSGLFEAAAAPTCFSSCLPCWPLSPFLWLSICAFLLLLFCCSCLFAFMFAFLVLVSFPVALDRRLAAAAFLLLLLVVLHVCLAGLSVFSLALEQRLAATALPLLHSPDLKYSCNRYEEYL